MDRITLDAGDGYVEVAVTGGAPDPVVLDVFEATNVYLSLVREGDAAAALAGWQQWLAERGLPGLSHAAVRVLANRLLDAVDEYAKKKPELGWATAASSGSTGSPSSGSPPPTS